MPIYEINQFRGGLSDYDDKGIPGAFKFGANLDIRKQIDSISAGQALKEEGLIVAGSASSSISPSSSISSSISFSPSASPSPTPPTSASQSPSASVSPSASRSPSASISPSISPSMALTSIFRDLIRFWVKASDGLTYGFGNAGYIYKRDADGNYQRVYKDAGGAINGAAEWYSDTGKTYLYWANASGQLHRKEIPGRNDWNDTDVGGAGGPWPKTNFKIVDWHTMSEAGGALMIANGSFLAMVGYDDSYTNEALDLIPGNIARTILERQGRTVIGAARLANPTRGVNGAIDTEAPLAQVGDGDLFYANFSDAIPVKRFPGGGKVNPGGVTSQIEEVNFFEWEQTALSWINKKSVGNIALFAVYNATSGKGGIYSYGRRQKNHPFVLNLDQQFDADELGAITYTNGATLVSYRSGSSFGVKAIDASAKAIGIYEGLDFRAPIKVPIAPTVWEQAELLMAPLPTGCSVEFWYRVNKIGTFKQAKTAVGQDSFTTAGERKAVFNIMADGDIFEPRVVLNPAGNLTPEIYTIRTKFK